MKKIKILCSIILTVLTFGIMCSLEATAAGTDFSNAMSISVNRAYKDNISQKYEQDFYKFTLSSPGCVYINFKHENLFDKNEYWDATIFDSETNEISLCTFIGTDTNVDSFKVGLEKGTYYLRIRGGGWYRNGLAYSTCFSATDYTFDLKYTSSKYFEKENNESYNTATPITLNKTYSGSINEGRDLDFYKFTLDSAGSIHLDFEHENLYDQNEYWDAVIYNIETNEISYYTFKGNENKVSTYKIGLDKGTYYLRIRGGGWYRNGLEYSTCYSTTDYSFNLKYTSSKYFEKENNDSYAAATPIVINEKYSASINDYRDLDYFRLNLKKRAELKIDFKIEKQTSSSEYYIVKVYDDKNNQIARYSISGIEAKTTFNLSLDSGEYYVYVQGGSLDWDGNSTCITTSVYSFKATIKVAEPSNIKYSYSTSAIKLSWNKVRGATGYKVYQYNTKTKKYNEIADTKKTSYQINNLNAGTKYKYAVRAYLKDGGATYYSSYAKITAATAPAQVTNLKFTSTAKKTGVVSYSKVSGVSGYQIYYSTSKNGTYKKLATTSNTKYTNKKFSSGKTYYVKVRAYTKVDGKTVYGAYSTIKSVKIK